MWVDEEYLEEIGLGQIPDDMRDDLVQQLTELIQNKVGLKLVGKMTDDQVAEFNDLADSDGTVIANWLARNIPDYGEIVYETREEIKNDIISRKSRALDAYYKNNPPTTQTIN
jgi:hypothetical protein